MKKQSWIGFLGFVFGFIVAYLLSTNQVSPTAVLDDLPQPYYSVLWENDHIRIVEHRMAPGESEPMHSHPEMIAYIIENSTLRVTEADGTIHEVSLTEGDIQQLPPWDHSIQNIGDTPLHTLLVELKH